MFTLGRETAEIAWIGKGNDKKRGQPIEKDAPDYNWLYLNGHPVICTRHMEAAAIATSMNPGINSKTDSEHHGQLQQVSTDIFVVIKLDCKKEMNVPRLNRNPLLLTCVVS